MAAIPDTSVTYEDLADLEHEFEDVETETSESSPHAILSSNTFDPLAPMTD